jgi:hypothetical protein
VEAFEQMKASCLFGPEDEAALRMSRPVLEGRTDEILDVWYGFVGSQPQLLARFVSERDGQPDGAYLAAVRARFAQWILDTADARYDARWLAWQHEIGLRHHRTRKNRTDGAHAAAIVPYRYLPLLFYPITATLKPFLEKGGHSPADVDRMHQAWMKSVLLQVALWSYPYVREGDF